MKNLMLIALIISGLNAKVAQQNIFDTKSGKIDYKISGSGSFAGMGSMKVVGTKRLVFDNYGKRYLEDKIESREQNIMGRAEKSKTHTLEYRNGVVQYSVDFAQKKIMRMINEMAILTFDDSKESTSKKIEKNLKSMGAKKLGKDTVLGKSCDVWEILGTKECLYKGIPLKIESNIMGIKQVEIATKIDLDSKVSSSDFKLPDFPVYSGSMESMMSGKMPQQIDKSKLEELDKKANREISKQANAISKSTTKESQNSQNSQNGLQNMLMAMMGGEDAILQQTKSEMLQASDIDALNGLESCYKKADNLKSANSCQDRYKSKLGGDMEPFSSWSESKKREAIKEIEDYKKAIPCIKGAKSLQELEGCMN